MMMSEQEVTAQSANQQYIAMEDAATELGVSRSTMYYYLKQLHIITKKFPLDKRTYIERKDLDSIRLAKRQATERRH